MLKNILSLNSLRYLNSNSTKFYNIEQKSFVDFAKMQVRTKKVRRAKSAHMKYPCIPVWMKEREKDAFDYPLRSRKEITFEQYMNPPLFNAKIHFSTYHTVTDLSTLSVHKADNRNNEVALELDINEMMLTPLQKRRLIFLLGSRWKKDNKVKIVCRNFLNFDHNLAKAYDILRQLYWETKRAPMYIWSKMTNTERRRAARKIFGRKPPGEMMRLKKQAEEEVAKEQEKFDQIFDSGNYTPKFIADNIQRHLDKMYKVGEKQKEEEERIIETTKRIEETLNKENLDRQLVKKRILTQKAYDTFYSMNDKDEEEEEQQNQQTIQK